MFWRHHLSSGSRQEGSKRHLLVDEADTCRSHHGWLSFPSLMVVIPAQAGIHSLPSHNLNPAFRVLFSILVFIHSS